MAVTVSMINMKGGVGKTTLAFNLAWYCAWKANLKVLVIDIDPQSNLSQYCMGAKNCLLLLIFLNSILLLTFQMDHLASYLATL
jgi:chromosome partitioning protein